MVSQTEVETPFGTRLTYSIGTESIWTEYQPSRKLPPLPYETPEPDSANNTNSTLSIWRSACRSALSRIVTSK